MGTDHIKFWGETWLRYLLMRFEPVLCGPILLACPLELMKAQTVVLRKPAVQTWQHF